MRTLIATILLIGVLASCKDEGRIAPEYLSGKWLITEALRNDKKTNTLNGAFFYFEGNIMTTNFLGIENQAVFELKDNTIYTTKGFEYTFRLKKESASTMEVKVEIQKTPFVFKLKKA